MFLFPLQTDNQCDLITMEKKLKQIDLYRTNLIMTDPDEPDTHDGIPINRVIYSEEGNETERISFDSEGEVDERVVIVYQGGKPVEEALEMAGELAERTTREYDDQGRVLREFRHYLDGDPDEIRYEYDTDGHMILRQLTDSDGEEGEKQIWKYENGKLVREESYSESGDLEISKTYTYAEDGTPEETVELSFAGGEETRLVTLYDEEGKMSAEKRYDARGRLVSRQLLTQDENGHTSVIEEETVTGKTIIRLSYDEAGNNILHEETTEDGIPLTTIHRSFDEEQRITEVEVRVENTPSRSGQHYRLRYEYRFFE